MSAQALDRAERALRDEAELLRAGRFEEIVRDGAERRALVDAGLAEATRRGPEAEAGLLRLKAAAGRNAAMLQAALDGLKDARREIDAGANARRRIGYGPDGAMLGAPQGPQRDVRG
ncbi:MAG: hypothetical protein AAF763_17960 [Pseudomonadota bacterium]